jgi:hypothetical protein
VDMGHVGEVGQLALIARTQPEQVGLDAVGGGGALATIWSRHSLSTRRSVASPGPRK